MFITKNKVRVNCLIMMEQSHIRESSRMGCPMVKESRHPRMEHNFKLNGLMESMLGYFELFFYYVHIYYFNSLWTKVKVLRNM